MVSIHSLEQHKFLVALNGDLPFWIGGRRDPGNPETWLWSDKTPWNYTNWAPREPNNRGGEDCVEYWKYGGEYWNDQSCSDLSSFVCKKDQSGKRYLQTVKSTTF